MYFVKMSHLLELSNSISSEQASGTIADQRDAIDSLVFAEFSHNVLIEAVATSGNALFAPHNSLVRGDI